MTTRGEKLKRFRAQHLVESRLVREGVPRLVHLMSEYSSHALCGPLACSLDTNEAKTLARCEDCESAATWRTARSV